MAKRQASSLKTITIIVVVGFLGAFFLYMWRYDYKIQRPPEYSSLIRTLRGGLRVDLANESGFAGPVAVVALANASPSRVRLIDTRQIFPLYTVVLSFKNEAGEWKEMAPMADAGRRNTSIDKDVFDKDQDAIAELVTGAAYTRAIPLSYLYNFKETTTTYQVTVSYQPEKIAQAMGETFDLLDVSRENVTGLTATFEWPVRAEVAPKAPAKEPAKTDVPEKE